MVARRKGLKGSHQRGIGLMLLLSCALVMLLGPLILGTALLGPLFYLGLMLVAALPLHKQRILGGEQPSTSLIRWLISLFTIQFFLGVFWIFFLALSANILQQTFQIQHPERELYTALMSSGISFGVQPWTVIAIAAVTMGIIGHFHQAPKSSETLRPLFGYRMSPVFASGVDILPVIGILMIVFMSINYLMMLLFKLSSYHHVSGLSLAMYSKYSLFLLCLVSVVTMLPTWQLTVKNITKKWKNIGYTIFIISILWIVMFFAADWVIKFVASEQYLKIISHKIDMEFISSLQPYAQWLFYIWFVPFLFAPFFGYVFMKISAGRTVREFVVAFMCLPTIFAVGWISLDPTDASPEKLMMIQRVSENLLHICQTLLVPGVQLLISCICFIMLITFFTFSATANEALINLTSNFAGKKHYRLRNSVILTSPMAFWLLFLILLTGFTGMMTGMAIIGMLSFVFCIFLPFLAMLRCAFGLKRLKGQPEHKSEQIAV